MITITEPLALQHQCLTWERAGKRLVLVPTMGYFHAGHECLMQKGRQAGDILVVSLFVNPTQFAPTEDLAAYPRDLERDAAIAARHGADLFFVPEPAAMYAPDHATWVEVPALAQGLCGLTRPTHFRGVSTIVAKLFLLMRPAVAVFGEKDWQQLAIIRRMVRDLHISTTIIGVPIVREPDGLALSSRNAYLTPKERAEAPCFTQGLALAARLVADGERDCASLAQAVRSHWRHSMPLAKEDYLAFIHPETLEPLTRIEGPAMVAAAIFMGKARLIDNRILNEQPAPECANQQEFV